MSVISWLHISDIHFCPDFSIKIRLFLPSMLETVRNISAVAEDPMLDSEERMLFATGDITFSGRKKDFLDAYTQVLEPVRQAMSVSAERVFVCPGNHDLYRSNSIVEDVRPGLLGEDNEAKVSTMLRKKHSLYPLLMKPFSFYRSFCQEHFPSRALHDPGLFIVEICGTCISCKEGSFS